MTLHLFRGRWWPIVCPPSDTFLNCQKGYISGAVRMLLLELTCPFWYTRLHVVHLVNQGPKYLPVFCPQCQGINLVALCMLLRVQHFPPWLEINLCAYYVVLLFNEFHYWLVWSKNTKYVVKPSLLYKRNDSIMKTLVFYVKEKLLHHKTLSWPVIT